MSFHVPENDRVKTSKLATSYRDGNNGLFLIPCGTDYVQCIASDGMGWEHVSVTVRTKSRKITQTPTWDVMQWMKEVFWDDEDVVIQFHPAKSQYVNNHPNVLHLWRPIGNGIQIPDSILVGIKT